MRHLDQAVTAAGGIALRYGGFYGAANDGLVGPVRKRRFPIVGDGGGVSSFIHLDDAAAATVLALERGGAGIYNIVDDEPAPTREWLPVLASVLGAKPRRYVPRWLARLVAGEGAVMMATESRTVMHKLGVGLIPLLLLLFPDGRPPSRRWRPLVWAALVVCVAWTLSTAVAPGPVRRQLGPNPIDWL